MVKTLPASARNLRHLGSIPGSRRFPGGGNGNPLKCSCLENPMDTGAWKATVYVVAKSQTRLKRHRVHAHTHTYTHTHTRQSYSSLPSISVSKSPFSMSVSLFLPFTEVHQYHFSRFHIYVLIYEFVFFLTYFTLYNRF